MKLNPKSRLLLPLALLVFTPPLLSQIAEYEKPVMDRAGLLSSTEEKSLLDRSDAFRKKSHYIKPEKSMFTSLDLLLEPLKPFSDILLALSMPFFLFLGTWLGKARKKITPLLITLIVTALVVVLLERFWIFLALNFIYLPALGFIFPFKEYLGLVIIVIAGIEAAIYTNNPFIAVLIAPLALFELFFFSKKRRTRKK